MSWRPPSTAPKDGSWILGWFDRPIVVRWRFGPDTSHYYAPRPTVWYWSDGYYRHHDLVAWQPVTPPDLP